MSENEEQPTVEQMGNASATVFIANSIVSAIYDRPEHISDILERAMLAFGQFVLDHPDEYRGMKEAFDSINDMPNYLEDGARAMWALYKKSWDDRERIYQEWEIVHAGVEAAKAKRREQEDTPFEMERPENEETTAPLP